MPDSDGVVGEGSPVMRRSRRPGVVRPVMRAAYIGNYLDKGVRPKGLRTNADVSRFLRAAALSDLGGVPVTGPSPDGDERIARMLAIEAVAAFRREGKSSLDWYGESIAAAVRVAAILHPELASDVHARRSGRFETAHDARTVLFCAMAITSQNNPVHSNVRYALEQFRHFLDTGRFVPRVYGTKGGSIRGNLDRFNRMLAVMPGGVAQLRGFLSTEYTMGQLVGVAEAVGLRLAVREMMDEKVYGSMVFGPKIGGSFYQNLCGNFETTTIDLWFMRTWGRLTGTILKDSVSGTQVARLEAGLASGGEALAAELARAGWEVAPGSLADMATDELGELARSLTLIWERARRGMVKAGMGNATVSASKAEMAWPGAAEAVVKAVAAPVDAPERRSDRRWIRSVVARALAILASNGHRMSAAQLQATLWYPERDLFGVLTGRGRREHNVSYDEAFAAVARQEKHDEGRILAALAGTAGHGGPGVPVGPGRGAGGAVRGVREEAAGPAGEGPRPHGPRAGGDGSVSEDAPGPLARVG